MDSIEKRWKSDETPNFLEAMEPVENVRTWDQAKEHLKSVGLTEDEIEDANRADLPERQIADYLAGKKGFIYTNYRPL